MRIFWVSLMLAGLCLANEEEAGDNLQDIDGRSFDIKGSSSSSGSKPSCSGCSGSGGAEKPSSSSSVLVSSLNNLINKPSLDSTLDTSALSSVTDDVLLKIGDVVSFLNSFGNKDTGINNILSAGELDKLDLSALSGLSGMSGLTGLASLASLGALDGGSGKLGKFVSVLNMLKSGFLELGVKGLEIANFVLAIIGLALIVAYLVENDGSLGVLGFGLTGTGSGSGYESGYGSGSGSYARSFMDSPVAEGLTNLVYDAITKYD